jgi:hypothetical protein
MFVLLLVITLGGQSETYVVDHGLTREDCQAAAAELQAAPGAERLPEGVEIRCSQVSNTLASL